MHSLLTIFQCADLNFFAKRPATLAGVRLHDDIVLREFAEILEQRFATEMRTNFNRFEIVRLRRFDLSGLGCLSIANVVTK